VPSPALSSHDRAAPAAASRRSSTDSSLRLRQIICIDVLPRRGRGRRLTSRRRMPAPNPPSLPSASRQWMLTPLKRAGSRSRPSAGRGLVSITMRGLTSARTSPPSARVAGESVSKPAIWCFFVLTVLVDCPGRKHIAPGPKIPEVDLMTVLVAFFVVGLLTHHMLTFLIAVGP
jgi:hypothetical protein